MPRYDHPVFSAPNRARARQPNLAVQILFSQSSPTLTLRPITGAPGTVIDGVIKNVSSRSQQVWPEEGRSTIGNLRIELVDYQGALTTELGEQLKDYGQGLRDREVRVLVGYTDLYSQMVRVATAYVDGVTVRDGVYTLTCRDKTKHLRDDIFTKKTTRLAAELADDDTTIHVRDTAGFEMVPHGPSFIDAPNQTVGYLRIRDSEEIIRYTGKTATSFTGCTRGIFRTIPQAVEWSVGDPVDQWAEIEELVYLELPGPAMAIALMTGILDISASPYPMLPEHWHLGLDWDSDFVKPMWTSIGDDLWDPGDSTTGFPIRFIDLDETDGKNFLEKEVFRLLGLIAPVSPMGQIGLRRVNQVFRLSSYLATLSRGNIVSYRDLAYDHRAVRNQFIVEYNHDGDEFRNSVAVVDQDSITAHGLTEKLTVSFRGLHTERHTQRAIRDRLNFLQERYADPPLRLSMEVTPDLNWLEIGDMVRVELDSLADHSAIADLGEFDYLYRTFEVQKVDVDWIRGTVRLDLLSSGRSRPPSNAGNTGAELADGWYVGAGANIAGLDGYVAASGGDPARLTEDLTLSGTSDINADDSIWYHAGDLRIESTVTVETNAQLRVAGFLTVTGKIDGKGNGHAGASDPGNSTAWSRPGTPGWLGPTRGGDGVWHYGAVGDRDYTENVLGGLTEAATRQSAAPQIQLAVSPTGQLESKFPRDLRGTSGGTGGQVIAGLAHVTTPGTGGTLYAQGGDGGASGAGLVIVCRGLSLDPAGVIDLSGDDGTAGHRVNYHLDVTSDRNTQLSDYPLEAGGGAGGYPGGFYLLLDGDDVPYPTFSTDSLVMEIGETPRTAIRAVDIWGPPDSLLRPYQRWPGELPPQGGNVSSPMTYLTGLSEAVLPNVNVFTSAARVQYAPAATPADAVVVLPPQSIQTLGGLGIVTVTFQWRAGWDAVHVFAATVNDRSFAEEVGFTTSNRFTHHLPSGGTRYYWLRARQKGRWSEFFNSQFSGSQAVAKDSGLEWVLTANPTRTWNGDAALTPIAWNPQQLYTDLHAQLLQFGTVIRHAIVRFTLNAQTGLLTSEVTQPAAGVTISQSTRPANTVRITFTDDATGVQAEDEIIAVQSGKPGADGPPGAPATRILNVRLNRSTFDGSTPGWLYLHGFDSLGNPDDLPGELYRDLSSIEVAPGSIRTSQAVEEGWIIYETSHSSPAPFAHGGTQVFAAAARKTREGWRYDNGTGWSTFTATGTMVIIGTYSRDASTILTATIFSTALGLPNIPVENAHQVLPGDIQPGAISEIEAFASTLRPIEIVSSLPVLPDARYPYGVHAFLTSDAKLYKSFGSAWEKGIDGEDIYAGTVNAAALAATIVLGTLIRTAGSGARVELQGGGHRYPFWIGTGAKGAGSNPGSGAALYYDSLDNKLTLTGGLKSAYLEPADGQVFPIRSASGRDCGLWLRASPQNAGLGLVDTSWTLLRTFSGIYHPDAGPSSNPLRLQRVDQPFWLTRSYTFYNASGAGRTLSLRLRYRYGGSGGYSYISLGSHIFGNLFPHFHWGGGGMDALAPKAGWSAAEGQLEMGLEAQLNTGSAGDVMGNIFTALELPNTGRQNFDLGSVTILA